MMSCRSAVALGALALAVVSLGCSRKESLATQPLSFHEIADASAPAAPVVAGPTVTVPSGSVDALAAAIAAAGPGGRVVLQSGPHTENGTVKIRHTLLLEGEPGAVLTSTTPPAILPTDPIKAAIHVHDAGHVRIQGIDFRVSGSIGNTAILLEDAPDAVVKDNRISGYQFGVMLQEANRATIDRNTVAVHTGWQLGEYPSAFGIVVINGDFAKISNNDVSGALFNIWACDENGSLLSNYVHDGFIGIILCKVPADGFVLPYGDPVGAEGSASGWMCRRNVAKNNFDAGFLVIDGAHDNMLVENAGSGNGTYDIELTGDTFRFGFLTPASFRNTVRAASGSDLRIKNCGNDNTVIRGNQVDVGGDPCS